MCHKLVEDKRRTLHVQGPKISLAEEDEKQKDHDVVINRCFRVDKIYAVENEMNWVTLVQDQAPKVAPLRCHTLCAWLRGQKKYKF